MYRTLLILLVVVAVLTALVKVLRANWRGFGAKARDAGADLAARGKEAGAQWGTTGRQAAGALSERAREHAADLGEHAQAVRDKAVAAAEGVSGALGIKHADALARLLERTLVIQAPAGQIAPVVSAGMARAPLFDIAGPVTPAQPGAEVAAWTYQALGTVRLTLAPDPRDPGRSLVGVAAYEVVMGDPQGGQATEHALDQVLAELDAHGIPVRQQQRPFTGAEGTDGWRHAAPLPEPHSGE